MPPAASFANAWSGNRIRPIAVSPDKPPAGHGGRKTPTSWASEDEDVRLMLEFQKGRHEAFEALVRRNTAKVHSLVFRFLADPSQAEDITQEVFLRVYRTARRYQPTAKFSTWLYRIAANLCFNVLRSRGKIRTVPLNATLPGDEEDGPRHDVPDTRQSDVNERFARQELRDRVSEALDRLPEAQKIAIILNKFEDKSYQDIAEVLQCSTMAVKSLLSRARVNLQESLGRTLKRDL